MSLFFSELFPQEASAILVAITIIRSGSLVAQWNGWGLCHFNLSYKASSDFCLEWENWLLIGVGWTVWVSWLFHYDEIALQLFSSFRSISLLSFLLQACCEAWFSLETFLALLLPFHSHPNPRLISGHLRPAVHHLLLSGFLLSCLHSNASDTEQHEYFLQLLFGLGHSHSKKPRITLNYFLNKIKPPNYIL